LRLRRIDRWFIAIATAEPITIREFRWPMLPVSFEPSRRTEPAAVIRSTLAAIVQLGEKPGRRFPELWMHDTVVVLLPG
jgi:hypothetical protein